ncbi:UvrD-helicase domain-containing protein [Billgrantia sp. LNSP4103-1]|uniref:UvrD-helicase domain-containing protein n=1 Tax=Billgrantia sp. LNSP4103-1 TaxID=3410266 RepID=UPI00403F9254
MEGFDSVRYLARQRHAEASACIDGDKSAAALLDAATELTDIERQAVPDGDPLLCGAEAILDSEIPAIFYKDNVGSEQAAFYQAHEFGHHWLDSATGACHGVDIDALMPEERMPFGTQRVEGYGPRERRECQANVFAREFLLPTAEARRLFVVDRLSASDIAQRLGLPLGLVQQQLARGLLVPDIEPQPTAETEKGATPPPGLDDSQRIAAEAEGAPHLIEAGPGTGKTRTLIARIDWLLDQGANPSSILALTFSNKAAEELRERVTVSAAAAAPAIWAGTFHAFGLELLRKFGHLLDLPTDVRLLDPSDALLLLEERLPDLPLKHYLRLNEPAFALRDILNAISRAKDELIGPDEYWAFGNKMLTRATDEESTGAAERVIEVAEVFATYERILNEESLVDFADLILKPIELLRKHPEVVTEIRGQYRHVLVDEYQDVNRASSFLLKELSGDGKNLWVVGDARQSIYRFRGASPQNIRSFESDFPNGKRLSLDTNYRSQAHVVRLVEAFSPEMRASAGGLPAKWHAKRGHQGGEVLMLVGTVLDAEAAGIAREIQQRHEQGVHYKEQAILCRSHTNLARFAGRLEQHGVPVLYLGDVFERPEIRDLLALLSFTCEPLRGGLLRIAEFPEYRIPLEDARAILAFSERHQRHPLEAIRTLDDIPNLSDQGRAGLTKLSQHLKNVGFGTSAAALLFDYLFTQSHFLDRLLADDSIALRQQRLAVFQLLQFTIEFRPVRSGNPRYQILQWVRRMEVFGDERQLRQLPSAASGIDAVRLMTIHASKGLEFEAVYLPALGTGKFPLNPQYNPCPPPAGMLAENPQDTHAEEEECLFFVAMSRARDLLCLSRAETEGGRRNRPSSLLTQIARHLPHPPDGPATWRDGSCADASATLLSHVAPEQDLHTAEDLDQYMRCPLSYFYQRVLGLSGAREDGAYVQFHRAVYSVFRWIGSLGAKETATPEQAVARLEKAWTEIGPAGHPYEQVYWDAAVPIIERAVNRREASSEVIEADWHIQRQHGTIRLRPDHVEKTPSGHVVRRLRTGKPQKKLDDNIYALYQHAAVQELGPCQVEALFLSSDEAVPVDMTDTVIRNRLKKYDEAMAGIKAGAFPPSPSDRACPRCPQYFICPAVPGTGPPPKKS